MNISSGESGPWVGVGSGVGTSVGVSVGTGVEVEVDVAVGGGFSVEVGTGVSDPPQAVINTTKTTRIARWIFNFII